MTQKVEISKPKPQYRLNDRPQEQQLIIQNSSLIEDNKQNPNYQSNYVQNQYVAIQLSDQRQVPYRNVQRLFWTNAALSIPFLFFGYNLTQLSCLPTGVLTYAYGNNISNSAIKGAVIGCIPIGLCIGVLISPFLINFLSRKNCLYAINACSIIFSALMQVNSIYMCIICRIFLGICAAFHMQLIPSYINQIIGSRLTKYFVNMPQFMIVLGVDISFALGLIFENTFDTNPSSSTVQNQVFYRVIFIVSPCIIIAQTILMSINVIPESPLSLLEGQKQTEARSQILLYNKQPFIDHIIKKFKKQIQKFKKKSFKSLQEQLLSNSTRTLNSKNEVNPFLPTRHKKLIFLGFSLKIMQHMTGIIAVVTQAGEVISFYDSSLGSYTPISITTVQLLATATSAVIIMGMGVKANIMFGNLGMGIINFINSVMFYYITWQPAVSVVFVGLIINMIIFGTTIGNSVSIYVPTLVPPKLLPLANLCGWFACTVCVIGMPIVMDAQSGNPYPAFFFFAAWSVFFFVVNLILISFKYKR